MRELTEEMIQAGMNAVSGFPRRSAIIAIWQAMEAARDSDGSPKGGDAEGGSVHDSAVPEGKSPK